ncbi:MAG TPA: sensor histidine kinase [Vicinamibacterales bacterium]|nr:sensor histidine kinase [Vicinamibacterales bacterium]
MSRRNPPARRPTTGTQDAEAVIHALRTNQVDAIVGDSHVMLVRLKQAETNLESSRDQLRALAARLESQRESERAQIAREIHDELGQTLTSLQLGLAWLAHTVTPTQPVRTKLASMSSLVSASIRSVRDVAVRLRPGVVDELGLVKTLRAEARAFRDNTGIPCRFETNLRNITFDREGSIGVFRIVQAALTNVARHARASRAVMTLMKRRDTLVVTVKDNGRGITSTQRAKPGSCGVIGMQERALALGGTLTLVGSRDKGTTLTVHIPLSRMLISGVAP